MRLAVITSMYRSELRVKSYEQGARGDERRVKGNENGMCKDADTPMLTIGKVYQIVNCH